MNEREINKLAKSASPLDRMRAIDLGYDPLHFISDCSASVRFTAVKKLQEIVMTQEPQIVIKDFDIYVVPTKEKETIELAVCDISPKVSLAATEALMYVKAKELHAAVNKVIALYGMENISYFFGADIEQMIKQGLEEKKLNALPDLKEDVSRERKKSIGMDM